MRDEKHVEGFVENEVRFKWVRERIGIMLEMKADGTCGSEKGLNKEKRGLLPHDGRTRLRGGHHEEKTIQSFKMTS